MNQTPTTRKTPQLLFILIERFGSQRLQQIADILLAFPLIMILLVFGLYLTLWHANPLVHFIHMVWVLGFWMLGTSGMLAFIILARLKLDMSIPILMFTGIPITLAIYFTPLSRFTNLFLSQIGLILPAAVGCLNVIASWLFVLRFRRKITQS